MAALTASANVVHKGQPTKMALPATGADTFYAGALVFLDVSNNTGQVQVASLAAGDLLAGICAKETTTTAAGDLVELYVDGIFALPLSGVAATDVGSFAICDIDGTWTDNPADVVSTADTVEADEDVLVGRIIGQNTEETGLWWVELDCGKNYDLTNTNWSMHPI